MWWKLRALQRQLDSLTVEIELLRQNRIGLQTGHDNCHAKINALAEELGYVIERPISALAPKHNGYQVLKVGRKKA